MAIQVTVNEKAKTLTIVLPLETPTPSASEKNLTIASTRGNFASAATLKGKTITIGVNAYIPNR